MRKKITSFTFIFLLLVFFVLVMILPKDENASVKENRPLAEMPELSVDNVLFGSFTTDYEAYLTDNVAFRSYFMDLGTKIQGLKGLVLESEESLLTLPAGNQLVLSTDRIMEIYRENIPAKDSYINNLKEIFNKFDCNKYLMLLPTQIEFSSSDYKNYSDSQKKAIGLVYSSLDGVKTVNAYDRLSEHRDEYIYFRTDHHWTQEGAYLGYLSFAEALGDAPLDNFKRKTLKGFLGYLYNQANSPLYSNYADDLTYFEGEENYFVTAKIKEADGSVTTYQSRVYLLPKEGDKPTYGIFMGGDHPFSEISTNNKNGKTLLVIKDSYANALLPFIVNHFEKVVVIDPRSYYGTLDDLKEEYNITDVAVINYCLSTAMPGYADALSDIGQ